MKTYTEFISICERVSAQGQLRYGSTPAKATDKSVSGAVNRALANPNVSQSASSEKGKTGVTGSIDVQYSGRSGNRQQSKPEKTKPEPKFTPPRPTRSPIATKPIPSPYVAVASQSGVYPDGTRFTNNFHNTKRRVPFTAPQVDVSNLGYGNVPLVR